MNAAGRHVAQTLHYHILDTEAMGLQLPKEAMMADITHPGAGFMMQVAYYTRCACQAKPANMQFTSWFPSLYSLLDAC